MKGGTSAFKGITSLFDDVDFTEDIGWGAADTGDYWDFTDVVPVNYDAIDFSDIDYGGFY